MMRLLAGAEDPVEHRGDVLLGGGEARHLGVGGVGEEQVDPLLPQPGEGPQVGDPAVERQLVHLEVAGVQHHAGAGADGDRERVGDGVVDRDELEVEGPEGDPVALGDDRLDGVLAAGARAAWSRAAPGSAGSRPAGCRRARAAGRAPPRCGPRGRGSAPAPRSGRAGPGWSRSRAGSGRRPGGSPRGRAPRSRRPAAARRTRRRSCCDRPRRARRAGSTRSPPFGSCGGADSSGWGWLTAGPPASSAARRAATSSSSSGTSGPRTRRLSSTPSSSRAALAVVAP